MTRKIVVTGGTGTLGRAVVARLVAANEANEAGGAGDQIVVVSRRPAPETLAGHSWLTADYVTGRGLDAAVDGASAVIHCLDDQRGVGDHRTLIEAVQRAGGVHLINISIVGIDQIHLGYYRRKREVEQQIERSGVPWTTLRTTQFHDLVATTCRYLTRLPIAFAPSVALQPIDVDDVARRLVELVGGEPSGRVADMGGPQVRQVPDLVRAYLSARRIRRPVVAVRLPGRVFRGLRQGHQLTPANAVGRVTFEQYLSAAVP